MLLNEALGPLTRRTRNIASLLNSLHASIFGYTSVRIQDGYRLWAEGVPVYLPVLQNLVEGGAHFDKAREGIWPTSLLQLGQCWSLKNWKLAPMRRCTPGALGCLDYSHDLVKGIPKTGNRWLSLKTSHLATFAIFFDLLLWQTAVDPGIQHGSGWPGPCVTTACLFQAIGDLHGRVFGGHMWRWKDTQSYPKFSIIGVYRSMRMKCLARFLKHGQVLRVDHEFRSMLNSFLNAGGTVCWRKGSGHEMWFLAPKQDN